MENISEASQASALPDSPYIFKAAGSRSSSSLPTEKCQTIREEGAEDGPMDQQISNCSLSKLIGRNTGGPSPTLVVLTSERR